MDWQIGGRFDGHAMDVVVLLPLSRVCEAHVAFGCHFAGQRWKWYIGSRFRGHAMDGAVFVAIVAGMRRTWLFLLPFRGLAMDW